MNTAAVDRIAVNDGATGVSFADTPEALSKIHQPDCAAVIWRRHSMPSIQGWIDALEPAQLPRARVILRPCAVRDAALQVCEASGTPPCANRDRLVDDVAALADIFAGLMDAKWLRLRLDAVSTNACRKFHVDAVTARLVCTYRGPGTQYGFSIDGAEPNRAFAVPTVSPILLRGSLWPERPRSGLLHRSPPLEGSGATRLVLVLDPVSDREDGV